MKHKNESTIIYVRTRKMTTKISESIAEFDIQSLPYHAGLSSQKRKEIQTKFMNNEIKIIVATIAFGMGINHKNIRLVIQYGCSNNIESYYQEIGRGGRDGEKTYCYLYWARKDFQTNRYFLDQINLNRKWASDAKIRKLIQEKYFCI